MSYTEVMTTLMRFVSIAVVKWQSVHPLRQFLPIVFSEKKRETYKSPYSSTDSAT
jgi:hypothetical protein